MNLLALTVAVGVITSSCSASAADTEAELEVGGALERGVSGNAPTWLGPSVAIEVTPIEHWLELEAGVSRFRVNRANEWDAELAFKKPFDVSPTFELMIGVAPTWTHTSSSVERVDSFGAELVVDLQFWRTRRWGFFLEPSYGVPFARGGERALAVTAGILVGLF